MGLLEEAGAGDHEGVVGGRLVDQVADPGVPAGVDLGGVVVVLGVLDPAGAQGQLLAVLEELVARAVLADEAAVLGVACARMSVSRPGALVSPRGVLPMYCRGARGHR